MLFDVQAALSEILGASPATAAAPATTRAAVAKVAGVATRHPETSLAAKPALAALPGAPDPLPQDKEAFPHGQCRWTGCPRTWTGKLVSLDEWRSLSKWERHGSTGLLWNGLTRQWEPAGGEV